MVLVAELAADLQTTKKWRVANKDIEAACGKDFGESEWPVKKTMLLSRRFDPAGQSTVRCAARGKCPPQRIGCH